VPETTSEQQELFRRRILEHDRLVAGYAETWNLWRAHLLSHGGHDVVPPIHPETNLVELLLHAHVRPGDDARHAPGAPSDCHDNVLALLATGTTPCGLPVGTAWTGYALSDDGLWRQHSWADSDGTVIETTAPRTAYAGVPTSRRTSRRTSRQPSGGHRTARPGPWER